MRGFVLIVALMMLALADARPAKAECIRVERDLCATENGHYRIRMPEGGGPFPTVVYLYGSTGNSGRIISNDGFVQAFVSRGYAVIVPAALDLRYADGLDSGWFLRHERGRKARNDASFVAEVIRDAEESFPIDRNKLMIAGMSRGGFLAWEIACHNPGLARAYAPVAAGYLGPMPARCAAPVRMLHTHGRGDQIVPFEADRVWGSAGAVAQPLDRALARVAATGGCTAPQPPRRERGYDRTAWQDCGEGASVDLLVHDGGHTIPLSWYGVAIDWFEAGNTRPSSLPRGGGTAIFRGAGAAPASSLGGRFKRAPASD